MVNCQQRYRRSKTNSVREYRVTYLVAQANWTAYRSSVRREPLDSLRISRTDPMQTHMSTPLAMRPWPKTFDSFSTMAALSITSLTTATSTPAAWFSDIYTITPHQRNASSRLVLNHATPEISVVDAGNLQIVQYFRGVIEDDVT
jgi:hypothetical protein